MHDKIMHCCVCPFWTILRSAYATMSSKSYSVLILYHYQTFLCLFVRPQPTLVKLGKALRKQQSIEHVVDQPVSQGHGHRPLYLCMANYNRLLIILSSGTLPTNIASIQFLACTSILFFKEFCCPVWFRYHPMLWFCSTGSRLPIKWNIPWIDSSYFWL